MEAEECFGKRACIMRDYSVKVTDAQAVENELVGVFRTRVIYDTVEIRPREHNGIEDIKRALSVAEECKGSIEWRD